MKGGNELAIGKYNKSKRMLGERTKWVVFSQVDLPLSA